MSDYARSERIAIRVFDGRMSESDAIAQTDAELKAKELPESIARLEAFHQKVKLDHAEQASKHSRRFSYDE